MTLIYWIFSFVTIKFISQLHTTNIYSLIDSLSLVPSCTTEATSGSKDHIDARILVLKQKQCLSPSELDFRIQSQRDDYGCSKNCLSNLIQRLKPSSSSNSINNNNNLTSFYVCQQIGHRKGAYRQIEALASPFQVFVVECRQLQGDVVEECCWHLFKILCYRV